MAFENGLYAIRFGVPGGAGAGVAYLENGKLRGGDSMMAYVGDFTDNAGTVEANVRAYVHTSVPGMVSIFGVNDVNIRLSGKFDGGKATLVGQAKQVPGVSLQVTMERLTD